MKGGINKIIRNITATSGKSDFEKVSPTGLDNSRGSSRPHITWIPRSRRRST